MNHHRTTREPLSGKLISIAAAVVMALVLGAAHSLDGPDDYSADWAQSEALQELQASESGTARREAAAQALCNEARGPNSEARWLPDGSLVCTSRRGIKTANFSSGD